MGCSVGFSTSPSSCATCESHRRDVKTTAWAVALVVLSCFTRIASSTEEYYHFPDEKSLRTYPTNRVSSLFGGFLAKFRIKMRGHIYFHDIAPAF